MDIYQFNQLTFLKVNMDVYSLEKLHIDRDEAKVNICDFEGL